MMRRIFVLASYFFRRLFISLTGIIYIILTLIYWAVLFAPGQGTPHVEYYIMVIGAYGAGISFLTALSVSARANRAANYPLVVRLPSRVEYLTAVLLSTFIFTTLLQIFIALLALFRGPELAWGRMLEIPPIWVAINILAAVLAMHASDFVTSNWSRVYIFGVLAILLFGYSANTSVSIWLGNQFSNLSRTVINGGWFTIGSTLNDFAGWLSNRGPGVLGGFFGAVFWPFRAIADAVVNGFFNPTQALAPAILLLYATILFMFAADLFATKDLDFME